MLKLDNSLSETRIQHALNGGEARIGPYRVDGLVGNEVLEFYGNFKKNNFYFMKHHFI
jgi:hypothetical protein